LRINASRYEFGMFNRARSDPTNGTVSGANLIRVAVTRDISQAVPVAGSFVGVPGDYLGVTVDVAVISGRRCEARSA
jgi:hypothetical protein